MKRPHFPIHGNLQAAFRGKEFMHPLSPAGLYATATPAVLRFFAPTLAPASVSVALQRVLLWPEQCGSWPGREDANMTLDALNDNPWD